MSDSGEHTKTVTSQVLTVASMKVSAFWAIAPFDISAVLTASIIRVTALIMEAVHISEMSLYYYETRQTYIPESCHLHTGNDILLTQFLELG
jgi:hypothetical protein